MSFSLCHLITAATLQAIKLLKNDFHYILLKSKLQEYVMFHKDRSRACNVIKKKTLAQVFSREFCEISKSTFSTEELLATASARSKFSWSLVHKKNIGVT